MKLWKTMGKIREDLESWISIDVCVEDIDGNCWGKYNPQVANGKIVFEWVLEDTPSNRQKILIEIIKRANIKENI